MEDELLQNTRGGDAQGEETVFATFEDVERLVSSIPRGPKGEDARVTAELIQEILNVSTPIKGVDYRDGTDGTDGTDGKDAPVLTGKDIADMLNALSQASKLDFSSIQGLNKMDDKVAILEMARKRNSADHEFYNEKINEILEWIDRIKGLKLMQAGSNRISATNINWSTVNWGDFFVDFYSNIDWNAFFTNVDWSQNNWTNFFSNVDWSTLTDWDTFVTSLTTNWTGANWDTFIDTFITNVDSDDVFNFLNQMSGLNKGDMLVYNSVTATWEILVVGADGTVITANSALDQGVEYAANASTPITVQEEGANVETALTTLNFTGAGATATQTSPGVVQVDIPGGGGGSSLSGPTIPGFASPSGEYNGYTAFYNGLLGVTNTSIFTVANGIDILRGDMARYSGVIPRELTIGGGEASFNLFDGGILQWGDPNAFAFTTRIVYKGATNNGRFDIGFQVPSSPQGPVDRRVNGGLDSGPTVVIGKAQGDNKIYLYVQVSVGVFSLIDTGVTVNTVSGVATKLEITVVAYPALNQISATVNGSTVMYSGAMPSGGLNMQWSATDNSPTFGIWWMKSPTINYEI